MSEASKTVIKTDLFTKVALTVIAVTLGIIAMKDMSSPAVAQMSGGCGDRGTPCYVIVVQ